MAVCGESPKRGSLSTSNTKQSWIKPAIEKCSPAGQAGEIGYKQDRMICAMVLRIFDMNMVKKHKNFG